MQSKSPDVTFCSVLRSDFYCGSRVSSYVGCANTHCIPSIVFHDNKKLKQGHFEMGIRYANSIPISNHYARKRATLCPLTKSYLKVEFNRLSWFKFHAVVKLVFAAQLYSFFGLASASNGRVVLATVLFT